LGAGIHRIGWTRRAGPLELDRGRGPLGHVHASDCAIQFACMSLVAIIPIVLYFMFSKWIMAGATAGAVKG
jgi:ABC-type glycerol-3-phosphate transport system permease component